MSEVALATFAERAVAPLDRARQLGIALALRSSTLTAVFTRRERRITAIATFNVVSAFVLALFFPALAFVLGPILLGVAHVVSDVRYLVLRQSLPRWWRQALVLGSSALIALRALEEKRGFLAEAGLETLVAAALVLAGVLAGARRGGWARVAWASSCLALCVVMAFVFPKGARLVLLHAHNAVAILLWVYLYARRVSVWLPLALLLAGASVLGSGVLYRVMLASPGAQAFQLHVFTIADWIAPVARADLALGLVALYVYLQSVHYAVWLRLIPEESLSGQGTLTFRMTVRSLFRDLGAAGVLLGGLAAIAVVVGAFVNVHRARALYLSLATFHVYLELALLAYFYVGRSGGRNAHARA